MALNTHWDHQGMVARRESAGLMSRWIEQNRRPGERLLVLGDFNAFLSEPSMKALTDAGVIDTRATARQILGSEATFNNFQAIPSADAQAIDYILVDPRWIVRRHATIAQHVNGRVASDHFPVVADLILRREAVCP
jgi:endonuclease/exonuclease/phosphatase family metal-dependent hydrolase